MPSATETAIQRQLTKRFIAENKLDIVLTPWAKTPNGSGGYRLAAGAPRSSQVMRLIAVNGQAEERMTLEGDVLHPGAILLGEWDAAVERHDRFEANGNRYEVLFVHEENAYQKKCEVAYLGPA